MKDGNLKYIRFQNVPPTIAVQRAKIIEQIIAYFTH